MWLFLDVVAFTLALLLHAAMCRLSRPGNTVVRFLVAGGFTGGLLVALLVLEYGLSAQLAAGMVVFAFFCELYIFLFTLSISSVSANLLLNLSYGSMTQEQIDRKYDSSLMVTQRMDRMIANGLIADSGGDIRLTHRGERLLTLFERVRRLFGHDNLPEER